jgi:hypothetical protein
VIEFVVWLVLVKLAGAVGGKTNGNVVAVVVELAEPPPFVAVNSKSYNVFADKSVIVADVAVVAGAVHVDHDESVDFL